MDLDKDLLEVGLSAEDLRLLDELGSSHKRAFKLLEPMIDRLVDRGYSRKAIWKFLCNTKGLTMSYGQFLRYVNGRERTKVSKVVDAKPEVRRTDEPKVPDNRGGVAHGAPRSKSSGVFPHDPQAKSLNEFAFGKDGAGEKAKRS